MKKTYRFFLFAIGILLVIFISGSVLLKAYSPEIQKIVIDKLNGQLKTKVQVGNIRYSFFTHFPYLSATFQSVTVMPPGEFTKSDKPRQPLLSVDKVILDMNVINALIYKRINIRRIIIQEGKINLITEENGLHSWDIIKNKPEKPGGKKHPVEIKIFRLMNIKYIYHDKKQQFYVTGHIRKAGWSETRLFDNRERVQVKHADLLIQKGDKKYTFPKGFDLSVFVLSDNDQIRLSNGELLWSGFPIQFNGELDKSRGRGGFKIQVTGSKIKTDALMKYLNERKIIYQKGNMVTGMLSYKGNITGNIQKPFCIKTTLHLSGQHMNFIPGKKKNKLNIKKADADITMDFGKENIFIFHLFPSVMQYGNSRLTGEMLWQIRNGRYDAMDIDLKGLIRAGDMYDWTGRAFSELIRGGEASLQVRIIIPPEKLKSGSWKRFSALNLNGQVVLKDLVVFNDSILHIKRLGINLSPGKDVKIEGNDLRWWGNPWQVKGEVRGLPGYLDGTSRLVFRTGLKGSLLDLEQMFFFFKKVGELSDKTAGNGNRRPIPVFESSINVDSLRYKGFIGKNVNGFLMYDDPVILLKNVSFQSMEGTGKGQMEIRLSKNGQILIKTYLEPSHINVKKLFYSFDNFGQDFIRAENLKGYVSGNITFQSPLDSTGRIIKSGILSDSYIKITDGELLNFEPLFTLSKFIRLSELKDIRFSTLDNEIFIHDQQVVIPDMQVNSSALDLSVSGIHHFDGKFDYHIGVVLSDYLFRRAKNANKNNSQFGIVEEDNSEKSSLFLWYRGDRNRSKISYDRRRVKRKISGNIKEEARQLKEILKGGSLSPKDSLNYPEKGKKSFQIEWPEEETKDSVVKEKKHDTLHKKKFSVTWEEEPDTIQKK